MVRSLFFFLVLLCGIFRVVAEDIVIDFSDSLFARLDAEGRELLSEYAKAYPKVKNFYENIRMDVNVKRNNFSSDENLATLKSALKSAGLSEDEIKDRFERSGQSETQYEMRHRLSDRHLRIDRIINYPVTPSIQAKLPSELSNRDFIQEVDITLLTEMKGYQLSKSDPSRKYFSLNASRDFSKPDTEGIAMAVLYFDAAPFSRNDMPLEHFIFQRPIEGKPYILEHVRQKEIDGEQIVEIKFSLVDLPDIFGVVWLDRNLWGVRSTYGRSQVTSPGGTFGGIHWTREMCTYDGEVDGVPLLKTYQREEGTLAPETQEERITRQILAEVTQLIPGPPDLSEFDVAQFLPPNVRIGEITKAQLSPARIIAIVIGVILIILGIYLKIREIRKK